LFVKFWLTQLLCSLLTFFFFHIHFVCVARRKKYGKMLFFCSIFEGKKVFFLGLICGTQFIILTITLSNRFDCWKGKDSNRVKTINYTGCVRDCGLHWCLPMRILNRKIFGLHPRSHVATTYLCMHFCSDYIGWSNQGKYCEIEMKCAKQDVATWLYD